MRTTDLFKFNRSAKRLNESLQKTFGTKINFEKFDTPQLEDARNKLRTQIYTARSESGFNETIENDTLTKAQFMHDAIVSELMNREEHIVDTTVQEGNMDELAAELGQVGDSEDYEKLYDLMSDTGPVGNYLQELINEISAETGLHPDDDIEPIMDRMMTRLQDEFGENNHDDEGGNTDDAYALASAGHGSDEDYESIEQEGVVTEADSYYEIAQKVYDEHPDLPVSGRGDEFFSAAWPYILELAGGSKKRANYMLNYDEDFPADLISAYHDLQKQGQNAGESFEMERVRDPEDWDEGNTEPPNNFAIYINGKQWKIFQGRGQYADDYRERTQHQQLKDLCAKKSAATGKKWTVHATGQDATESIQTEKFDPLKHVKNPTQGEKDAAKDVKRSSYGDRAAMLRSAENNGRLKKDKNESINTGEDMRNLREGEIQQASAIVTAKTMVDRVGRWIEELSGMENDTLLQLGDSIRDEMGAEQAKTFISSCAPAIQQALQNLKDTREALSTSVRQLTGEEQPAEMLGGEPGAEMGGEPGAEMGGEVAPAAPDEMNAGAEDEFGAAEPAAGGPEEAGREMRESINRQNRLMNILAG